MDITEVLSKAIPREPPKRTSHTERTSSSAEDRFYKAWYEDMADRKRKTAERIRTESNLGVRFSKRTFATFDESKDPDAFRKCKEYADHYQEYGERNSLLLIGGVGTGKTHLMASIANRLLDKGIPVLFDTFDGHLYKLKAEFDGKSKGYLQKMQRMDMLMIDDVGKEKQTEWSRSIMFDVINYRYEHLLPIVISSNYSTKELAEYFGDAVWSRICEMSSGLKMSCSDYRRAK